MSNFKTEIDSSGIDKILNTLDDDQFRKDVMLKGLTAGAETLRQATSETMQSKWPAASHFSKFIGQPIYAGVNIQKDKAYNEVQVDILKRSKVDWRVRFYESQIKERVTKKGQSSGTVTPYHFFRDARQNAQQQIEYAISKKMDEELKKIK